MIEGASIVATAIGQVSQLMVVDVGNQQDVAKVLTLQGAYEVAGVVERFPPEEYMALFQQYSLARDQQRSVPRRRK
tara:strand:+ start:1841 stop:2068 length:228 start_codon:yes stop_codon:yes gene_type:complete